MESQNWKDKEFCTWYDRTWEISTEEVHYGWLAPGENHFNLLDDLHLSDATVLDVGCGMGENLIALARRGAECFGLDISEYMVDRALDKWRDSFGSGKTLHTSVEDMRIFQGFAEIKFDLILSVYSLEYLESIRELRNVLAILYHRLSDEGKFVFSFSHPLQHHRHRELGNRSGRTVPEDPKSPLIYSFQDVITVLDQVGFHVERVIELSTKNPSKITYEEGKKYPYHYARGRNPCKQQFDDYSNRFPHTVLYRVFKPKQKKQVENQPLLPMEIGKRRLWGENRTVTERLSVQTDKASFHIDKLAPYDSAVAIMDILEFSIESQDFITEEDSADLVIYRAGKAYIERIPINSLIAIILRRLEKSGLDAFCEKMPLIEKEGMIYGTFIERIDPLFGKLRDLFPRNRIGLLVFVNNQEPGAGRVGLDSFTPSVDDKVSVRYLVSRWGEDWPAKRKSVQLDLF